MSDATATSGTLTDLPGVRVGHWTDAHGRTGCTVVLFDPPGAVTSGMVLGSAPGSREFALLAPEKMMDRVDALLLAGGSAFGLDAATGVVRYLEERGAGFPTPFGVVPIVPAAVLFDLGVGDPRARPDADAGYAAAVAAGGRGGRGPVAEGSVGVGAGATVGKFAGFERAQGSGIGSAVTRVRGALVGALAVSNASGDLVDPANGELVAGCGLGADPELVAELFAPAPGANTTLVAVVTDAPLGKAEAHALAVAAHVGIAQVTRPSHTANDGDTAFVSSVGRGPRVPVAVLGVAVQAVVARALLRGARAARDAGEAGDSLHARDPRGSV
ncbi:MAG: P1 family peptidase [Trueperaceae bacterium]|nr:P1 family peptidase [Trueperaceae bacterium]